MGMEIAGKGELPQDADLIREVASVRKPSDALRVVAESAIKEVTHDKSSGTIKEIVADATGSELAKGVVEKAEELRDAAVEKVVEVALCVTPGGQALTAAMVAKEVAKTVGKEAARYAVKEITSQAVDATESESLQRVKGNIVNGTVSATEKGLGVASSRGGDSIDQIPTESPYPRIKQASASEVDIAKESAADAEVGTVEEREREVVEGDENSNVAEVESNTVDSTADAEVGTVEEREGEVVERDENSNVAEVESNTVEDSTADAEVGTVEEREREVVEGDENSNEVEVESNTVADEAVENVEGKNRTKDALEGKKDTIEKTDNTNHNNDATDGIYIEKLRMEPPVIIVFKCPDGVDPKEFLRQIKGQERGLNSLTISTYTQNREAYERRKSETGNGRDPECKEVQELARKKALASRIETNQKNGMTYSEAKAEAENWIKGQAALHNPDQIAGGNPSKVSRMGDASVNSSIGAQWRSRVAMLDQAILAYCKSEGVDPGDLTKTKLNIKLEMEVKSNGTSSRAA